MPPDWVVAPTHLACVGVVAPDGFLAGAPTLVKIDAYFAGGVPPGGGEGGRWVLPGLGGRWGLPVLGGRWGGVRKPAEHCSAGVTGAVGGNMVVLQAVFAPGTIFARPVNASLYRVESVRDQQRSFLARASLRYCLS